MSVSSRPLGVDHCISPKLRPPLFGHVRATALSDPRHATQHGPGTRHSLGTCSILRSAGIFIPPPLWYERTGRAVEDKGDSVSVCVSDGSAADLGTSCPTCGCIYAPWVFRGEYRASLASGKAEIFLTTTNRYYIHRKLPANGWCTLGEPWT